jgi:hypothetical protein
MRALFEDGERDGDTVNAKKMAWMSFPRWTAVGMVMVCFLAPAESFLPSAPSMRSLPRNGMSCAAKTRGGRVHVATSGLRMQTVDDKTEVREYFNNEGFNRYLSLKRVLAHFFSFLRELHTQGSEFLRLADGARSTVTAMT